MHPGHSFASPPECRRIPRTTPAMPPKSRRPIILVDDSPDDLVFLRRTLDKAEIRNPVIAFLRSEDALAHLRAAAAAAAEHPDLFPCVLFLDVKMPGNDG